MPPIADRGVRQPRVCLHIGYPKTASTWLQRHVLSDPSGPFCTPWSHLDPMPNQPGRSHIARRWTDPDANPHQAAEAVAAGNTAASLQGGVPALSEETLIGYIGDPGIDHDRLSRLRGLFPDASVLLTTRAPRSMARSCYAQSVIDGGTSDAAYFLRHHQSVEPGRGGRDPRSLGPAYLRYGEALTRLRTLWGNRRVWTFTLEDLRDNRPAVVAALRGWGGLPETWSLPASAFEQRSNPSPGAAGVACLRRLNRVWPRRGPYELRWVERRLPLARAIDRVMGRRPAVDAALLDRCRFGPMEPSG